MATKEKAWTETRALALAKQPHKHKHPTLPGFYLDVSPKLRAVWRYRFKNAQGEEVSGTLGQFGTGMVPGTVSLKDAERQYRALWDYHKSRASVGGALTLESAFNQWLAEHKKKGGDPISPRTRQYYQESYNRYIQPYGQLVFDKITPDQWRTLLKLAAERSVAATRGAYWMIHAMYDYYVELEVIERNPVAKRVLRSTFAPSKKLPPRRGYLKALNVRAFLRNLQRVKGHHSKDAVMTLLFTGWRLMAVLKMRWADVDFERKTYTVREQYEGWKGWTGVMPLSDYVLGILEARRKIPTANGEYIFPARHGEGEHMKDVQGALDRACENLDRITAHDLRRTFATVGDIIFTGDRRRYGRLMGHKYSDDKQVQEEDVTSDYAIAEFKQLQLDIYTLNTTVLELAGHLPLDPDTVKLFAARGIELDALEAGEPLELLEDVEE